MLRPNKINKGDSVMIVASDLDRTLIYSNRAIAELGCPEGTKIKPVEEKDGNWISFMTEASFSLLQEICRQYLFVPITTRSTNQFERISIFQQEIALPYAITANGAVILRNGIPFNEWSEIVASKMKAESAVMQEILSILYKEDLHFNGRLKRVEDLFFYYILEKSLEIEKKNVLNDIISSFGWRVYLQGRKLYFIPKAINKGDALEFICTTEGKEAIAGSGDSKLDWDFLNRCRFRFVPNHSELVQNIGSACLLVTKECGLLAGEEILRQYLTL